MIVDFNKSYEGELKKFLYKYNSLKEYFIAWVGESCEETSSYDKSNFLLCIENAEVVGALGVYISEEQKLARLLGPIIIKEYFHKYKDDLYEECIRSLPGFINEVRVAFYKENQLCKDWFDKKGFELYNSEMTMILNKDLFRQRYEPADINLVPYKAEFKEGLSRVHPRNIFFTLDELISKVDDNHNLLLAVKGSEVLGYVYFEGSKDNRHGEVALLHIREDIRKKGYGRALLNASINWLLKSGIQEISISVRTDNYIAKGLYESTGFVDKETIYAYKKHLS